MDRQRFDIMRTGGGWLIRTATTVVPGYISRSGAVRDAMDFAAEVRAAGRAVEVYLWEGEEPTRLDRNREDMAT